MNDFEPKYDVRQEALDAVREALESDSTRDAADAIEYAADNINRLEGPEFNDRDLRVLGILSRAWTRLDIDLDESVQLLREAERALVDGEL